MPIDNKLKSPTICKSMGIPVNNTYLKTNNNFSYTQKSHKAFVRASG